MPEIVKPEPPRDSSDLLGFTEVRLDGLHRVGSEVRTEKNELGDYLSLPVIAGPIGTGTDEGSALDTGDSFLVGGVRFSGETGTPLQRRRRRTTLQPSWEF